jgi:inosine-uridine nucleoside N-ribohydrolase
MDETLITDEITLPVDVCADYGLSYGQSLAYIRQGPVGTQNARIIKNVDKDRLWKLIHEYCEKF